MSRSQFWVRAGLLLAVAALVPACGRSRSRGGVATNVPGVVVDLTSLTSTSETGSTTSFTVALATLPSDDVVINLSSSNTSEGTVSPAQLTFTAANGTTAQTVTVTGEDDALLDGNIAYTIVIAAAVSTDANYSGVDAADVNLTNNDDEVIGITVTPTALGDLTEGGAAAQFTVALSAPAPGGATVTVPITVTAGEVTVDGPGSGGPATTFNLDL
ncbi:MAG TPA: hypothetical protein VEJ18_13970, partial [Planctomycetota bacterium]|nr:hypothetical protein [Planctomycetota bacterium]